MGERHRRRQFDIVVFDGCDHLVAGPEVLEPQSASERARGLAADQLGLACAFGFWFFPFVLLWGSSGFYFVLPQVFSVFFVLDPGGRFTDQRLFWLSELH